MGKKGSPSAHLGHAGVELDEGVALRRARLHHVVHLRLQTAAQRRRHRHRRFLKRFSHLPRNTEARSKLWNYRGEMATEARRHPALATRYVPGSISRCSWRLTQSETKHC